MPKTNELSLALLCQDSSDITTICDSVELFTTLALSSVSKAELSRIMSEAGSVFGEEGADDAWSELDRRSTLYGGSTPFEIRDRAILPRLPDWTERPDYALCLLLSRFGNDAFGGYSSLDTGKLFERITNDALIRFLGGEGIVFGSKELPLRAVCEIIQEQFVKEFDAATKDRGVDVITWLPFLDDRINKLVLLTQCAGGHGWRKKTRQVPIRAWEHHIHFAAPPIRGFVFAEIIDQDEIENVCDEIEGIFFDRARIYQLLTGARVENDLLEEMKRWVTKRVEDLH